MAERCDRCKGAGRVQYLNKDKKQREKSCPDCLGLGKIIKPEKKNGVLITERPEIVYGIDYLFDNYLDDHLKAYAKTKIKGAQQVLDKKRNILEKPDIKKLQKKVDRFNRWRSHGMIPRELEDYIIHDDYLVIAIENMGVSHKKDYGKGYMYKIIKSIQTLGRNLVRYIYTNWDDSTKEGRAYLIRQGFKRKKNLLLWENPAHATEHGFLQTPGDNIGNISDAISKMVKGSGPEGNKSTEADKCGNETENKVPDSKPDIQ